MTVALSMGTISQRIASGDLAADPLTAATGGSSASPITATPETIPKIVAAPGTFEAPVSETEKTTAMPATIVTGDTPGDRILGGLNKRWAAYDRAMRSMTSSATNGGEETDTSSLAAPAGPLSADRANAALAGRWSPISEEDDGSASGGEDAMIDGMSDAAGFNWAEPTALHKGVTALEAGGQFAMEMSYTVKGVESSIKTLVTGQ